jgi:hypothetical protein
VIRLLLVNHLRLFARAAGLRAAAVLYAAALAAGTLTLLPVPFVDTPAPAATPALSAAWWLWAALTPWWVSRFLSVERGAALTVLAAQAGAAPQEAILAQLAAAFVFAAELALVSLPIGMIAYVSGRALPADVAAAAAELAAFSGMSIVVTFHCSLRGRHRLGSWAGATIAALLAAAAWPYAAAAIGRAALVALVVLAAAALGAALPLRARRELLYLPS